MSDLNLDNIQVCRHPKDKESFDKFCPLQMHITINSGEENPIEIYAFQQDPDRLGENQLLELGMKTLFEKHKFVIVDCKTKSIVVDSNSTDHVVNQKHINIEYLDTYPNYLTDYTSSNICRDVTNMHILDKNLQFMKLAHDPMIYNYPIIYNWLSDLTQRGVELSRLHINDYCIHSNHLRQKKQHLTESKRFLLCVETTNEVSIQQDQHTKFYKPSKDSFFIFDLQKHECVMKLQVDFCVTNVKIVYFNGSELIIEFDQETGENIYTDHLDTLNMFDNPRNFRLNFLLEPRYCLTNEMDLISDSIQVENGLVANTKKDVILMKKNPLYLKHCHKDLSDQSDPSGHYELYPTRQNPISEFGLETGSQYVFQKTLIENCDEVKFFRLDENNVLIKTKHRDFYVLNKSTPSSTPIKINFSEILNFRKDFPLELLA